MTITDEEVIADLKQFISATVSQHTTPIRDDVATLKQDVTELKHDVAELKHDVKRIDKKVDDLSSYVADALDASNEVMQQQLDAHEKRITHLEQKTA